MCEQKDALDLAVDEIIKRINSSRTDGETYIVLIAGGSASGKTTIAQRLHAYFKDSILLRIDDYYFGRRYSEKYGYNYDQPESIDMGLVKKHLSKLKQGKSINLPIYSFIEDGGKRIGSIKTNPAKIVFVEGLFALHGCLREYGDLNVFIDTDCHGRLVRRILRDLSRTVWSPAQILNYFFGIVQPMQELYVEFQKEKAEIVIRNPYNSLLESESIGSCEKEVQVKIELSERLPICFLMEVGVEVLEQSDQIDWYFKIPACDGHENEIIRVRSENGNLVFGYKAEILPGDSVRVRNKLEFLISEEEFEAIKKVCELEATIIKHRKVLVLGKTIFSQDCVKFGRGKESDFIEIRNLDGHSLESFLQKLGLEECKTTTKPYIEILKDN